MAQGYLPFQCQTQRLVLDESLLDESLVPWNHPV